MFKKSRDIKNKEMDIMQMLKELLGSVKIEAVVNGLQSDFELSVKNIQGKKKGMSSPEIMLKGTSAGMLVGISLLVKEVRNKYDVTNKMIDEIIDTLEKGEVTEEEFFKIKKQDNKK